MAGTEWLIDKSALVRLGASSQAAQWANRVERGLIRITTITLLEVGYSARTADDLRTALSVPPISSMPTEYLTPAIEDRSVGVLSLLADRGHHRAPSLADMLVCAAAELGGLTVLHVDKDFELIAAVTGQAVERLS